MKRRAFCFSLAVLAGGCATEFEPIVMAPRVNLQDPLPGMAIVYLIRAPHDSLSLPVYFDEVRMATLPSSTYTAVLVKPGTYAVASAADGAERRNTASTLTLQAGERRFLYLSAATGASADVNFFFFKGGAVPLVTPTVSARGARVWKECSELDAQGLMSIAKPVLPEPHAL